MIYKTTFEDDAASYIPTASLCTHVWEQSLQKSSSRDLANLIRYANKCNMNELSSILSIFLS